MKTVTNRSTKTRTLARSWDDDSGEYDYFFLTAAGLRRYKVVTTKYGVFEAGCYYAHQVRKGELDGKFSFRETEVSSDLWTQQMAPGEAILVPTHCETYHQCAMRSGQFSQRRQYRHVS